MVTSKHYPGLSRHDRAALPRRGHGNGHTTLEAPAFLLFSYKAETKAFYEFSHKEFFKWIQICAYHTALLVVDGIAIVYFGRSPNNVAWIGDSRERYEDASA